MQDLTLLGMRTPSDRSLLSPAVVVAAAASGAVVVIAALGALTTAVAAAALGVACAIAVLSYGEARPERLIHALRPLAEATAPLVVHAPRARELTGHAERQTDAA